VNFFSDDRMSELRALFFESAQELLQAMNDAGLDLEKRPDDLEVVRTIRRVVHTLKGDSAACGFTELSELAHELEEVLTPEIAARADAASAQVVLTAADMFDSMLSAYQGNIQPPDATPVYDIVRALVRKPGTPVGFNPNFDWSECERSVIARNGDGHPLYDVAVEIDPQCAFPSAAVQLVKNVLIEAGELLALRPDDTTPFDRLVMAVVASDRDPQWIEAKCKIPSIAASVVVKPYGANVPPVQAASHMESNAELEQKAEIDFDFEPETGRIPAAPIAVAAETPITEASHAHALSESVLRVDAERIDNVLNLVGELVIGRSMLAETMNEFGRTHPKDPLRSKFADLLAQNTRVINDLQRSVMKIRMVPVEQLFRRVPRIVRDVAKRRGKDVQVVTTGHETDLDKSILDALAEPLTHLVRNAVDHGIEMPTERVASGKPAQGTVKLNAYHQGNHVVVEISDDGRGIDAQSIAAQAVKRGLIESDQVARLSAAEILDLIFESDFSTAGKVDDISGRGVGLDVVRSVLQRVKGSVSVISRPGEGTTFLLRVPLTLAIIRALLFRVLDRLYALPLQTVLEIARASSADIHKVDNYEVLRLRNELVTLFRVSHLERDHKPRNASKLFVIVTQLAGSKFGLVVDKLEGEEELVIKALDDHLVATDLVSGASILGDGRVVLILNVAAVVDRLSREAGVASSGLGITVVGRGAPDKRGAVVGAEGRASGALQ
jgi:two-component system, chemotaxis family, sensor kinase CheA